jgi:hypothetical protein
MIRSESTSALGQPSDTKEILGAFIAVDCHARRKKESPARGRAFEVG